MLARPQARRDADFQVERDSDQLARCAFLLFKTPSFWTYDNETPRHTHWMTFYKDAALKAVEEGK